MDLRKCLFFDHFFSALSSKKRVLSILASLLVISLVIYLTSPATDTPSSPSLFSWFFPSGTASSVEVLERTHHRNSSKEASFSGRDSDLGETQFKNHTGDAKNSTVSVSAKPPTVVLQTQVQNSSGNGSFSGESTASSPPTVVLQTHAENSTANGSLSGESTLPSPLGKAQEGNSSTSTTDGVAGQVLGKAHVENATKDGNLTRVFEKKDGVEGKDVGIGESATGGKNVSGGGGEGKKRSSSSSTSGGMQDGGSKNSSSPTKKKEKKNSSSDSMRKKPWLSAKCNIFNGRWVRDETKPYYPVGSCPLLDDDFNCHKNGRPDDDYLKWKWQPYDCDIPSLNATDFLSRLRGKRLLFVGDSLNRNMWESLVCILRHSIKNKKRVYEASGKSKFKTRGYYSFKFEDYKCSVDYVRSPFLVRELYHKYANGSEDEKLRLDLLDDTTPAYRGADIIVFNTGHWWTHEKTSRGIDYYQEGNHVYPVLKVMEAYKKGLTTWARWVDKNINPSKTRVFFRGYSLTHFRGGQWNSGGQCHKETEPIFNQAFLSKYPPKMKVLEEVLKQMKTPVIYLNISQLTDYRKDGHPSIYRMKYNTVEEQIAAERFQDCSHWCLPGVPDAWNELLYASLLVDGKGSWRQ